MIDKLEQRGYIDLPPVRTALRRTLRPPFPEGFTPPLMHPVAETLKNLLPLSIHIPEPCRIKPGRRKKTKSQNLLERLCEYESSVLVFLHDKNVPFSNNLAEQDIRMIKVRLKISGCFRTLQGAKQFARIRSYISTARKQASNILDAIASAVVGQPYIPSISL
ncbi:MAG TPA: transposase [Deltaproteobacteria bacterium]|nr:transposase [Deltaproteobacteria bacterium]